MSDSSRQADRSYPEFAGRIGELHAQIAALVSIYGEKDPDGTAGIGFPVGARCATMLHLAGGSASVDRIALKLVSRDMPDAYSGRI